MFGAASRAELTSGRERDAPDTAMLVTDVEVVTRHFDATDAIAASFDASRFVGSAMDLSGGAGLTRRVRQWR